MWWRRRRQFTSRWTAWGCARGFHPGFTLYRVDVPDAFGQTGPSLEYHRCAACGREWMVTSRGVAG